jgi:curved DNA-binding protein CbpA
MDPYSVLGLAPGASQEDVKRAFRKRVLTCHPDVVATETVDVQQSKAAEYRRIVNAYEALTGPRRGRPVARASSTSSTSSSYAYQRTSGYYRADGGQRGRGARPFSFSTFAHRAVKNSLTNGGILVLSGVFFGGMMAVEPVIEGMWMERNAGKLFKDMHVTKTNE